MTRDLLTVGGIRDAPPRYELIIFIRSRKRVAFRLRGADHLDLFLIRLALDDAIIIRKPDPLDKRGGKDARQTRVLRRLA